MFKLFSKGYEWMMVPTKFKTIIANVENNTATALVLTRELFEEFGSSISDSVRKTIEQQLIKLKEALINNTSIESVYIEGHSVPPSIIYIIESLELNKNIKKLYLNCSVGWNYNSHFALAEVLKVNITLEYLYIHFACNSANNYMPPILEALHHNTSLSVLALSRYDILTERTKKLLENLPQFNTSLQHRVAS